MHLTPDCTALSPAAITGIKELGMNAVLLCKNCVERDDFIRCRTLAKVTEKIDSLDGYWGKTEEIGKAINGLSG